MSNRRLWALVALVFAVLFLGTAHWWGLLSVDSRAADYASWRLAHTGSMDLTGVRDLPADPFFVRVGPQIIPDRTMGVILLGLPLQLLFAPFDAPPDAAGTLTAALCTAVTVANIVIALVRLGASRTLALAMATTVGLGTAIWTVAAAELWSHTASLLALSTMILALTSSSTSCAALAIVPVVWSRPHLAVVPLAIGLALTMQQRRLRPVLAFAGAGATSLGTLMLWNLWIYGRPSLAGSYYGAYVGTRLTARSASAADAWLENLLGVLFSPLRGAVLYSPVLVLGGWCVVVGWRRAPLWTRGAMIGGLCYLGVQLKLNDFTGGNAFFGNRLIVETVLLAVPVAYVGYAHLARTRPAVVLWARGLAAVSVSIHLIGAVLAGAAPNYRYAGHPWRTWLLADDIRATWPGGAWVAVISVALCTAAVAVARLPSWGMLKRRLRIAEGVM
jgi:hypothetical protein